MKKETVALIALIVIVLGSLTVFVVGTNTTLFTDLFSQKQTVAVGDCVNVSYIGRYASNHTVFDSSYKDSTNKTGDSPLNIFVSYDKNATAPKSGYTQNMIKGFMDGLIGMTEGQTKTIGPIAPKDAYGEKLVTGVRIKTPILFYSYHNITLNETFEVTNITNSNLTLQWLDPPHLGNFTMTEGVIMGEKEMLQSMNPFEMLPPYFLWENASRVVNVTNESVTVNVTPYQFTNNSSKCEIFMVGENYGFVFPNATTLTWTNSTINLTSTPKKGTNYVMLLQGIQFNITVGNISGANYNVTISQGDMNQTLAMNKTFVFNRTLVLRRNYVLPMAYAPYMIGNEIKAAGYSIDHLAGESLIFEVTVDKIYKTSS